MNIFILDENIDLNVQYHCDKHIVKMPLELAQMISTAYYVSKYKEKPDFLFKASHINHPCNIWVRKTRLNFRYACHLGLALYREYQYRYNQPTKMQRVKQIFEYGLKNTSKCETNLSLFTKFIQAMPDDCKHDDTVVAYRRYYNKYKKHLFSWKNRSVPYWVIKNYE